ncbi:MAG: addiction module antidote protein [Cyanobacteria bacterium P01_F01_bin.143]
MAKIKTRIWDAAEHLETKEDMAAYLEAALEDGDPALITAALEDIARSKGIKQLSHETGLDQDNLYKALSTVDNPALVTVFKIFQSLGLKLQAIRTKDETCF